MKNKNNDFPVSILVMNEKRGCPKYYDISSFLFG
jgi:hypothetical protein